MKSFFSSIFPSVFKSTESQPADPLSIHFSQSSDSLQILLADSFYVISFKSSHSHSDDQESAVEHSALNFEFKMEASRLALSSINFGAQITGFSHLDRTQLIAVAFCEVSGTSSCVSLIDSYMKKEIKQLFFKNRVTRLKLLKSYLVISFEKEVWVYNILPFQIKDTFLTSYNPTGLFDVSQNFTLISFGSLPYELRVQFLKADVVKQISPFSEKKNLGNFCISRSGKLIAVVDEDGIEIKIIDGFTSSILKSLRRGSSDFILGLSPCKNSSLAFSLNDTLFAMASERKTIHVFKLPDLEESKSLEQENTRESIIAKGLQILDEYVSPISLSSEKSSIKIRLEEDQSQFHKYQISFTRELDRKNTEYMVRWMEIQFVTNEEGKLWCYEIKKENNEARVVEQKGMNWKEFIAEGNWRTQAQQAKRVEESQDWIYIKE